MQMGEHIAKTFMQYIFVKTIEHGNNTKTSQDMEETLEQGKVKNIDVATGTRLEETTKQDLALKTP